MRSNWHCIASAFILTSVLSACGGGDSSDPAVPASPSANVNAPVITTQPLGASKGVGDPVTFTVVASGSSPVTYQWRRNDVDIAGANAASLNITALTAADDGATFTVSITNAAGTVTSAAAIVKVGRESKDTYVGVAPTVSLSTIAPASNDTITIKVALAGATSIAFNPVGDGCGALRAMTIAGAQLETSAIVGNVGTCVLSVDITGPSGVANYTNEFTVTPRSVDNQGLSFKNGVYIPSGNYAGTIANTTVISQVRIPQSFINGGSGIVYIDVADPSLSKKALFKIAGVPGYFVANGQIENGALRFDMTVAPLFLKDAATTSQRMVTAQMIAADGTLSQPIGANASFQRVGSGPLQVSLSFDRSDDVDLHVVTPAGNDIFYGNRSANGGSLDLDSNPGCAIDNVNNENIVWPTTVSAANGVYKVRVDLYESCSGLPVNYTVKVVNCGAVSTFTGSFVASDADFGSAGAGREVAQIAYASCSGFAVAGRATYDDYAATFAGLSATARELAIRHATVEVRQVAGDTLLATGATDENGDYAIDFGMAVPGQYYVKVLATQDNATVHQKVTNSSGELYAIRSAQFDASTTARVTAADLRARRDASFAEAFNIFDLGVAAFKETAAHTTATLPMLTWEWTRGTTPPCATSCYQHSSKKIFVLSSLVDEDSYDDSVLAHEFGHFFMQHLAAERSPGGTHASNLQSSPLLAWSEGAATYFGQQLLHSPQYIDTSSVGAMALNIEDLATNIPRGTAGGVLNGNVSEAIVAATLWDLSDNAQDSIVQGGITYKDTISNTDGVFATMLGMQGGTDRAAAGPDLVDFLDTFICKRFAAWEPVAGSNFRGLVTVLNGFPYTVEGQPACRP